MTPDTDSIEERAAKRADALKAAKAHALQNPPDLAPLRELARIEEAEVATAADAADLAERAAAARTAREALAVLDPGPDVLAPPCFGAELPRPVLWRAGGDPGRGALIGAGEVAILAGPGQGGKSTVALALAHAAGNGGEACGLHVARGKVALLSYEDSPARLAHRMGWYGAPGEWKHVRTAPAPAPLWAADPEDRRESGPSAWWPRWWGAVAGGSPVLVVIDPASVAFAGAHPSDGAAVRAFLLACTEEAERIGAGVLILAHDTKGARNETRAGHGPGAGMVSGSAQWFDGARAVLHLSGAGPGEKRLIVAEKSNYGASGWGARLIPRFVDGNKWRGLGFERRLNRETVAATRKDWATGPDAKRKAKGGKGRIPAPDGGPGL